MIRHALGIARWGGLPPARARSAKHLFGVAVTAAAAKVILATVGLTLFVSEEGAAGLPLFYLSFAPVAILLSFGLGAVVDRAPRVRLAQLLFASLVLLAILARLGLASGSGFALLGLATAFEIIVDIAFWTVVAAHLDAYEVRRSTSLLYMGLALGGALGGVAARIGVEFLPAGDIVLLLLPVGALLVLQLEMVGRRLQEVPDGEAEDAGRGPANASIPEMVGLLRRYPLAILIALNGLVVTLLYGLAEFLILGIYEDRFTTDSELATFLSLLFAAMQVVEFALLFTLTRALVERASPLVRNLVFPLTTLGALGSLLAEPRATTAVVAHLNIEAASNALFLPIHNANFMALPAGFQGRARTLSEGVCYPIGLAAAGWILWGAAAGDAVLDAEFAALIFLLILLLLGSAVGLLVLPTLLVGMRRTTPPAGGQAVVSATDGHPTDPGVSRARKLLRNRDPAVVTIGLELARRLDPMDLEAELRAVAERPEEPVRAALARLVAHGPDAWSDAFIDDCLARRGERPAFGLVVMLIRRTPLTLPQLRAIRRTRDPTVVALGHLVVDGPGTAADGLAQHLVARLLDAALAAGRSDLALALLDRLEEPASRQIRRLLALLLEVPGRPPVDPDVPRRLLDHPDGAVRAAAAALLGRFGRTGSVLRPLGEALGDPQARVRNAAAAALASYGERGVSLTRRHLAMVTPATVAAVRTLIRNGTPRGERLLTRLLRELRDDASRTDRMLALTDPTGPLGIALVEHRDRLGDVAYEAVLAVADHSLARHLRSAISGAGQRRRAHVFEVLAAQAAAKRSSHAIRLLRQLVFEGPAHDVAAAGEAEMLGRLAERSRGPWVRRIAAVDGRRRGAARGGEGTVTTMDDQQVERIIRLKQLPLFRDLSLDVLREVVRGMATTTWLAGERVMPPGTARRGLLIIRTGRVAAEGVTLVAPACLGETALTGLPFRWPEVVAVEASETEFLDAATFEELGEAHPELLVQLGRRLAEEVHRLQDERRRSGPGPGAERSEADLDLRAVR